MVIFLPIYLSLLYLWGGDLNARGGLCLSLQRTADDASFFVYFLLPSSPLPPPLPLPLSPP